MSTVAATNANSVNTALLSSLGLTSQGSSSSSSGTTAMPPTLSQNDFLKLLTAQLQYQDPTQPVSSTDFASQMEQMTEVSGITSMQSSMSQLASSLQSNQSLQAAALVGQSVMVPGSTAALAAGGSVQGAVNAPASGDVVLSITNAAGQVVNKIDLGTQAAGMVNFTWNGQNSSGSAQPAGTYSVSATVGSAGQTQAATTYVAGLVNSVSVNSGSLVLNVQGQGAVPFSQVQQIM
jgi:flagellar basal-body rod modification protein FlgD